MLSHTKYLTVKVPKRMDFLNITGEVEKAVNESGVREGLCLVNGFRALCAAPLLRRCQHSVVGGLRFQDCLRVARNNRSKSV